MFLVANISFDRQHNIETVGKFYEYGDYYESHDYHISEIELMQWTGLQDNNNVDLYEGDIIIEDFLKRIGQIKFGEHETSDDYYATFAYGFYIQFTDKSEHSLSLHVKLKILGNIYQDGGF